MKRIINLGAVLALATLWVMPVVAQEARITREGNAWVQVVSGSVPAARNLKLFTDRGSVTVRGGQQQNITYTIRKKAYTDTERTAQRQFEAFTLRAVQRGDVVILEGSCPGGDDYLRRKLSVDITLETPRELAMVKLITQGGSVSATNIAGKVMAETAGGSITMNEIGGGVYAQTHGGSIAIGDAAGDLKLETAGGGISIRSASGQVMAQTAGGSIDLGTAAQDAVLETAGGSIQVRKCGGELRASTAGGSVEIGEVGGPAILETAGGSIRLAGATGVVRATTSGGGIRLHQLGRGAIAETAAGPVFAEFIAQRNSFTESALETSVGDIVVYLPSDLGVTVRAFIEAATGHSIRSDFPEVRITSEGSDYGPREIYGQGAINGGGPLLKIRTTSGNIELRRGRK
ncbi:MAG TPA: hypothetical protein VGQ71_08730 [Terriglobales bacterium]|nr:hypothetical protein [Terriglobales bacterium]